MVELAWCTDTHLDFLDDTERLIAFGESLVVNNPDGVVITGDISSSSNLVYHLSALERIVARPLYFVLGNHDYFGASISAIRNEVKKMCEQSQYLRYLSTMPYISLSQNTAIVGHDGWYDGRHGDAKNSSFIMSDWVKIAEFAKSGAVQQLSDGMISVDSSKIISISQKLAYDGTVHVMNCIKSAVKYFDNIIVATHFPPFVEVHRPGVRTSDVAYHPWYTSKVFGDMMLQAASTFPNVKFTILCGHTHGHHSLQIQDNLHVHVGASSYGSPKLAKIMNFP